MLSINDDNIDILHARLELLVWSYYPLEFIFSVVLFGGFSCLKKPLCDHFYQSSDSSSIVDEDSKILHHHCIRIRKVKTDKVNFSLFILVSFFASCIDCVVYWSKIFLYPRWTHPKHFSLGGGSWGVFIFACPFLWYKQR